MSARYRLLENLGVFRVQKLIITKEIKTNFLCKWFPKWFKEKITITERYETLNSNGDTNHFFHPPITFKTKEKAIEFVESLGKVYHDVELNPRPEFPKDR